MGFQSEFRVSTKTTPNIEHSLHRLKTNGRILKALEIKISFKRFCIISFKLFCIMTVVGDTQFYAFVRTTVLLTTKEESDSCIKYLKKER